MKLITDAAWFRALRNLAPRHRVGVDAADMGTAFGLDSITIVCDEAEDEEHAARAGSRLAARSDWHRRLDRRSRL